MGGGDRAAEDVEQPGQALAAAPEPAGALELLAVGGPAHLGVDVGQQRRPAVALAGEERERLVEPAAVEVRVEVAEAGRQAAAHLAVGRGAVPPRERAPAVAQAEERVELLEQLHRRRAAAQRPDADAQPGRGRRGDLQDGERDVEAAAEVHVAVDVLAADVARRTVAADEAALEQERAELRARRLVVDRLGLGHPAALGGRRLEVRPRAGAHGDGLADVEHLALGVADEVDAGLVGQAVQGRQAPAGAARARAAVGRARARAPSPRRAQQRERLADRPRVRAQPREQRAQDAGARLGVRERAVGHLDLDAERLGQRGEPPLPRQRMQPARERHGAQHGRVGPAERRRGRRPGAAPGGRRTRCARRGRGPPGARRARAASPRPAGRRRPSPA